MNQINKLTIPSTICYNSAMTNEDYKGSTLTKNSAPSNRRIKNEKTM